MSRLIPVALAVCDKTSATALDLLKRSGPQLVLSRVLLVSVVFAAWCVWPVPGHAGQYNEVLSPGDAGPEWTDLPGTDGKKHSFADFAKKDVVVVVFTCNSCEYAQDYEDRLIALAKKYAGPEGKVGLVAINVNKIEADSLPKMKERAESKGFPFPYLYDETQKIARAYGAVFTPECFVLNKERKVVYMGGVDDNSIPDKVKSRYLELAVEAALKGGTPEKQEAESIGCRIRYARERKTK